MSGTEKQLDEITSALEISNYTRQALQETITKQVKKDAPVMIERMINQYKLLLSKQVIQPDDVLTIRFTIHVTQDMLDEILANESATQ